MLLYITKPLFFWQYIKYRRVCYGDNKVDEHSKDVIGKTETLNALECKI